MPAIDSIMDKSVVHLGPWRKYKRFSKFFIAQKVPNEVAFLYPGL